MRKTIALCVLVAGLLFAGGAVPPGGLSGGGRLDAYTPKIALPDTIVATVGHQLNLWNDQLTPIIPGFVMSGGSMASPSPVSILWSTAIGDTAGSKIRSRGYRYTPAGAASFTLTAKPLNVEGEVLSTHTTRMTAVADNGGKEYGTFLMIGDSRPVIGGLYTSVATVDSLFRAGGGGAIRRVGTRGTSGNYNECRSGWAIEDFMDAGGGSGKTNPFWNTDHLDFVNYMKAHGDSTNAYVRNDSSAVRYKPDLNYVAISLGVNDVCTLLGSAPTAPLTTANYDTILAHYDRLINGVLNATYGYPLAKVLVVPPRYPAANLWGFGAYNSYNTWWPYYIRSIAELNRRLIARYDARAFNARVDICSAELNCDRWTGYPTAGIAANSRTSSTERVSTNFLHYGVVGGYEIGDMIYNQLRWELARKSNRNLLGATNGLSEDFTTWAHSGTATQAANGTAPDGGTDAQFWITPGSAKDLFSVGGDTLSFVLAADNCISVYVKPDASARIRLDILASGFDNNLNLWIDATTCALNAADATGETGQNPGIWGYNYNAVSGWCRIWRYAPATGANVGKTARALIWTDFRTDNASRTIGVWGAQLEHTKYPTSYMKRP